VVNQVVLMFFEDRTLDSSIIDTTTPTSGKRQLYVADHDSLNLSKSIPAKLS
jgi:hypothetical protein